MITKEATLSLVDPSSGAGFATDLSRVMASRSLCDLIRYGGQREFTPTPTPDAGRQTEQSRKELHGTNRGLQRHVCFYRVTCKVTQETTTLLRTPV